MIYLWEKQIEPEIPPRTQSVAQNQNQNDNDTNSFCKNLDPIPQSTHRS